MINFTLPVWQIVKIFFLVGMGVYLVFAFVIIKQVKVMLSTIEIGFEAPIRILAWLHMLFAVFVFILALLIL